MQVEQRATKAEHGWTDYLGFTGPVQPGNGPRRDPVGDDFPTGPELGERFPDVIGVDQWGTAIDVHDRRGTKPLVFVFFRSAVW